jgi:hypothetical protein
VLAAQPGHLRADRVGGELGGLAVECPGFLGDGEVLISDGAAGDLGVAQGHVQAAVTGEGRDGLQAHAAVDRLGGQGVPQLPGVDVRQPGGGAGLAGHPGDGVPVQGPAVFPRQQQRVASRDVSSAVAVDEGDELGVQWQVAVLAELAGRDVQPGPGAGQDHGTGGQAGEFADSQSGAEQHFHGDAYQHPVAGLGGAQQPGGGSVIEGFGQGWSWRGRSPGIIGTLGGTSSQPRSSMRKKNIRSVPRRCAMVAGVSRGLFCPGQAASQGLQASIWRRVTWLRHVTCGAASAGKPAKHRKAWPAFSTLRGRSTQAICSR